MKALGRRTCHDDVVAVPEVEEGDLVDPLLESPLHPVPEKRHLDRQSDKLKRGQVCSGRDSNPGPFCLLCTQLNLFRIKADQQGIKFFCFTSMKYF